MKSINTPIYEEFKLQNEFFDSKIKNGSVFTFKIGGVPYSFSENDVDDAVIKDEEQRVYCTRIFRACQIEIRLEAILYKKYPIVEWTLFVKNNGRDISPRITFSPLEMTFKSGKTTLYGHKGSDSRPEDHMPYCQPISNGDDIKIAPFGGRSTNHEWPYFSLALSQYGLNVVIGWLGQWEAEYRKSKDGILIKCGQQRLDSVMKSGEEFRSPRIVLQFWNYAGLIESKAVRRSQNIFRRYMREYNMPRKLDGTIPTHDLSACSSHQFHEMTRANTENQIEFIDRYEKRGIKLDNWWMDAGWYPCGTDWQNLGTWRHDAGRFPNGLEEISAHARAKGVGTILWHEPERVRDGSELASEHPDFLLPPAEGFNDSGKQFRLFNFGNDDAREWITERISSNITKYGVSIYRQDFNTDMLSFVEPAETAERKGAIENHYVCGMLKYWDTLLEQHPGLIIDECAAGGRRDDIDAMKRAIVFIRSDYLFEPIGQQCHMGWLSEWLPFSGTGIMLGKSVFDKRCIDASYDRYALESCFAPHITACFDPRDDKLEWGKIAALLEEWHEYVDCYSGDYYPLNVITPDNDKWALWQFNRCEEGDGVIQAFRRPYSVQESFQVALNDLDPDKNYSFHRYDTGEDFVMNGNDAMEKGIIIKLAKRGSTSIKYSVIN